MLDQQPDGVLIFQKTTVLKPPQVKKAEEKKPKPRKDHIYWDDNSDLNQTPDHLDSSFGSFVNSVETVGEEEFNMEMVFSNRAILKIMGVETSKDLQGHLTRPLFVNRDHGNTMSLIATTNHRYSDNLLGQAYIYSRKSTLLKN